MGVYGFDHYTVRCANLARSRQFYAEALGLEVADRPGATMPAALVYVGGQAMVHLFEAGPELETIFARLTPPDAEAAKWATGRMHHIALLAHGLLEMRERLGAAGITFTERTIEAAEKHLIVLRDPDGVELELQFALSELE
jgi:catechol 2,3-dioxygenase-like lactoylglutathione lyase family enzyme